MPNYPFAHPMELKSFDIPRNNHSVSVLDGREVRYLLLDRQFVERLGDPPLDGRDDRMLHKAFGIFRWFLPPPSLVIRICPRLPYWHFLAVGGLARVVDDLGDSVFDIFLELGKDVDEFLVVWSVLLEKLDASA